MHGGRQTYRCVSGYGISITEWTDLEKGKHTIYDWPKYGEGEAR